jgi:hypothetical protein
MILVFRIRTSLCERFPNPERGVNYNGPGCQPGVKGGVIDLVLAAEIGSGAVPVLPISLTDD